MLFYVYLGIGSNTGNRFSNLKKAIRETAFLNKFSLIAKSQIYETEPWGFINQNKFLNCVICGLYKENPFRLFNDLKRIENKIGRTPSIKWGPREIDIDLLFFGDKIIRSKKINIPHPFIEKRNFVLKPLSEINPGFVHPVIKKTISALCENSSDETKVKIYRSKRKFNIEK